jgi:hypothetical protein
VLRAETHAGVPPEFGGEPDPVEPSTVTSDRT